MGLYEVPLSMSLILNQWCSEKITMKICMSTITKVSITRDLVKFQVFFSIILLMFSIDFESNRILVIIINQF